MTPQEQAMLNDLIGRVGQTQLTEKDPEAEQLLNSSLGRNPDSLYILAQTVLVQKYALEQAQAQINQLRQQAQPIQPTKSGSFLGNLLGHHEAPPPPPPPPTPGYGAPPSQPYAQPWQQVPPSYGAPPPQSGGMFGGGGGSSFLRSAATTAAGVAAGALAFQGVESLMHGFEHTAGFGGNEYLGGLGGGAPGETVINNYYDDSGRDGGDRGYEDRSGDLSDLQASNDNFQPTLDDDDLGNASIDDTNVDDSSYDDSSSNDLS